MKLSLSLVLFSFFFLFLIPTKTYAIVDPLGVANNKVGIHILFPDEIKDAAALVNTNGGDWGYVTIPIQAGDRNLEKWQKFMDDAKSLHLIPIFRIASEGDYFNTKVWRKPNEADVLDFANFLNSLTWPTKNRYVTIFNEVNRGDEWGGSPNPDEYANLLSYAITVFKSKSQDFFIISAGLDNASANVPGVSMNEFDFMRAMNQAVPGIFYQVDGLGSHSYPNPGFSQPPTNQGAMSVASYRSQNDLVKSLTGKTLPVFITETGWSQDVVSPFVTSIYYQTAFASVWSDEEVVAVTPFLLKAGSGPFTAFSFYTSDNKPTLANKMIVSIPKVKGTPKAPDTVLGEKSQLASLLQEKTFTDPEQVTTTMSVSPEVRFALKWLLKFPTQ